MYERQMEETSLASFRLELPPDQRVRVFPRVFAAAALEACIHPPFCITLQLYHLRHPHCQPRKPRAFIFTTTSTFFSMTMMLSNIRARIRLSEQVAQAACGTHGKFFGSHRPPFSPMIYIREYAGGSMYMRGSMLIEAPPPPLPCIAKHSRAQIRLLSAPRALKAASPATPNPRICKW